MINPEREKKIRMEHEETRSHSLLVIAKLHEATSQQIEETRTQAILSACFARMNQNQETEAKSREDSKLEKARLWWKEQE